jgi:DNA repair exonuclease SbcCD ATPase subunit
MIIIVAVIVALGALFYTLFIRVQDIPVPIPVSPVQHLEDRKHAIYDNLRDLQFEYRLGKLSADDYQQTKQALQKELAVVLAETEATLKRLDLTSMRRATSAQPAKKQAAQAVRGAKCPHCGASFPQALKFCGECGKAIA